MINYINLIIKKVLNLGNYKNHYLINYKKESYSFVLSSINYQLNLDKLKPKPTIVFASCCDNNGDAKYNGGTKLQNLWVKLLRKHGYEAYRVTKNGKYVSWLIDHQPHVSIKTLKKWKSSGKNIIYITTWLKAKEFIDLAPKFYYFDAELYYTRNEHFADLIKYLPKITGIATHTRYLQAWYMSKLNIKPSLIPEWSDSKYWKIRIQEERPILIGYTQESFETDSEVDYLKKYCTDHKLSINFIEVSGSESQVLKILQKCKIFIGFNQGKDNIWGEGCPRTQQEAMHAGCVVIAYDVLGNREYLLDGFNGYIVRIGRVDQIAEKLKYIIKNPKIMQSLQTNSISFIKSNFTEKTRWKLISNFLGLDLSSNHDYIIENRHQLDILLNNPVYLASQEVRTLAKYARLSKNCIVEIGCAYGASTAVLLLNKPSQATLTSIDPFVPDSEGAFIASYEKCSQNIKRILSDLKKFYIYQTWNLLKDFSYNVVEKWDQKIDLLFIDGNHQYDAVKKDFDQWLPHIKKSGYIIIHDSRRIIGSKQGEYNRGWEGPTKLSSELQKNKMLKLIETSYSMTIWQVK